ncbi:MAG: LysE family translocator [Bacillota bacterium]
MEFGYLLKGILIGFSIAAPVGPIGILCIRRSLTEGWATGFIAGLGAASADAIYGCIAAFGLTMITNVLTHNQFTLSLIGGLFLLYLGIQTFRSQTKEEDLVAESVSKIKTYTTTFFLTLTNPMTILSFTAIFAGLGLANNNADPLTASLMVAGVFTGSSVWWFILSKSAGNFKSKLPAKNMSWINKLSGLILLVFGAFSLLRIL